MNVLTSSNMNMITDNKRKSTACGRSQKCLIKVHKNELYHKCYFHRYPINKEKRCTSNQNQKNYLVAAN